MTSAVDLRIAVVGGGTAGLATALALARHGIASVVLERRSAFEEAGAGIQIGPNGMRILATLGIAERLAPHACAPEAIVVMSGRGDGRQLTRLPLGAWIAERHGAPYWVVHRQDLHAALVMAARERPDLITIVLGDHPVAIDGPERAEARGIDQRLRIRTMSGATILADAVVGADGIHSWTRSLVAPGTPEPRFTGRSAARAVVPIGSVPPHLREPVTRIWLGSGAHVVHYPVRQAADMAIIVIGADSTPRDAWNAPADRAWVERCIAAFPSDLHALVAASDPGGWRKWPLREMAPLSRWSAGRFALVGDAAHPILPFLAQGGVLALEDAVTLASEIAARSTMDMPSALAAYESIRRPRAKAVVDASKRNGRIYHLAGPFAAARDAVLRLTPPARLMAAYDWLYGWRL